MESAVLLISACLLGFLGSFFSAKAVCEELGRVMSSAGMQESVPGGKGALPSFGERERKLRILAAYYARNGIATLRPCAERLMGHRKVSALFQDMAGLVARAGWDCSPASLGSVVLAALLAGSVVVLVVFQSWLTFALAPVCMTAGLAVAVSQRKAKEQELLRDQVPEALRCMEACLHAGASLPQAFAEVAAELPSPSKDLFARVSQDLDLGYSMNEALSRFHKRVPVPELAFVAMALDVQYACGGSATPILHSAERSVSQGVNLKRSLRVQTAQARLSAQIVCLMPFALLFVISAVSPGFLDPFFTSTEGFALLMAALAMQAAGVMLVKRGSDVGL